MQTYVVIGLGNPGSRFTHTRHNLGQRAVQAWQTAQPELSATVVIYQPISFMNDIGPEVARFLQSQNLSATNLILVHDEVELDFGQVKIKEGGSAAGHNGVRSIQETIGTQDIPRLRLGVGRPDTAVDLSDYVLERFTPTEEAALPDVLARASDVLTTMVSYPRPE